MYSTHPFCLILSQRSRLVKNKCPHDEGRKLNEHNTYVLTKKATASCTMTGLEMAFLQNPVDHGKSTLTDSLICFQVYCILTSPGPSRNSRGVITLTKTASCSIASSLKVTRRLCWGTKTSSVLLFFHTLSRTNKDYSKIKSLLASKAGWQRWV